MINRDIFELTDIDKFDFFNDCKDTCVWLRSTHGWFGNIIATELERLYKIKMDFTSIAVADLSMLVMTRVSQGWSVVPQGGGKGIVRPPDNDARHNMATHWRAINNVSIPQYIMEGP